jgi:predicted nucleic-acid-binding protein
MKKVVLDTNCFLRLLLNDIPEQADKVEALLKKAQDGKVEVFVPQIILFELHFALEKYYHLEKEAVILKLKVLVTSPYLQIESQDAFILALQLYSESRNSFVDCFLDAQSKLNDAEVFTFDKKLQKQANK